MRYWKFLGMIINLWEIKCIGYDNNNNNNNNGRRRNIGRYSYISILIGDGSESHENLIHTLPNT